jgi:hypothetical protein
MKNNRRRCRFFARNKSYKNFFKVFFRHEHGK